MSPISTAGSLFTGSNLGMSQVQRPGHTHSVLPQGNTSTSQTNSTGATQSFADILSGIMGGSAKND